MKKRFLRSSAALRSRPLRRRKPSPIWLRHPGMARLRQPTTTSVLTTRNRTTPYQARADGETRSDEPSDASAGAEVHEAASAEQVANSVSESSAPEQGPEAVSIAANPPVDSDQAIEAGQSDACAAGPAPVEGSAEGADASSATPAGLETQAAAEAPAPPAEAKPPHESRRGGSGKHNHGRSRGSRPKPSASPPPPPTPPAPHAADPLLAQLAYVIVNEAGASVYSTSQIGREELPEFDATLRSAISIGRRLQDPLAELVKIEPQNIGVGLYQHDVNPKQLKETLESVISSCVNFVGVDLNTASVPLLRHVSGLNQLTARRIVDHRKDKGTFATREQLMEVEGVGPATYTQAAGFLKIPEGVHPLDRTWIHPESYDIATRLLEKIRQDSGGRARQGAASRAASPARGSRCVRAGQRAAGRRVHAQRHHRGPWPPRARPARRPAQADLQEGHPQARGPDPPAWS